MHWGLMIAASVGVMLQNQKEEKLLDQNTRRPDHIARIGRLLALENGAENLKAKITKREKIENRFLFEKAIGGYLIAQGWPSGTGSRA